MKTTKLITSIVTITAIATTSANAAVKKDQCIQSDKTIWVENVQNADGTRGACVPKNACSSSAFKNDFCIQAFKDIQVNSAEHAKHLVQDYAKIRLGWKDGCTNLIEVSINNKTGQDIIGCYSNGNYKTFEFDDTNESDTALGMRDLIKGNCIVLGGQFSKRNDSMICSGIDKRSCDTLEGEFTSGDSTCNVGPYEMTPTDIAKKATAAYFTGGLSLLFY